MTSRVLSAHWPNIVEEILNWQLGGITMLAFATVTKEAHNVLLPHLCQPLKMYYFMFVGAPLNFRPLTEEVLVAGSA